MEIPVRPRQRWLALMIGCVIVGELVLLAHSQPVGIGPRWLVSFPASQNGRAGESTVVPVDGSALMVAVIAPGANPMVPSLRIGNQKVQARIVAHDPVSRLGFLKVDGGPPPRDLVWLDSAASCMGMHLQAVGPSGAVKCIATGWVKQVGGKILPLALMRVSFDPAVPPAGTPLLDASGRVAGIVFQSEGNTKNGYAIPAEAVHRVRQDLSGGGRLVRGWLGLSLLAENQVPRIVRVLPGSPAQAAGIQPGDVLVSVDSRQISDYADAVNAFFYLIPGRTVPVKVVRGVEKLEFNLTPVPPKAG